MQCAALGLRLGESQKSPERRAALSQQLGAFTVRCAVPLLSPMLLFAGTALIASALFAPLQVAASPSEEAIEAAVAKMLGNMTVAQKARQLV